MPVPLNDSTMTPDEIVPERPVFRIVSLDDPQRPIFARDLDTALHVIISRVNACLGSLSGRGECVLTSRKQRRLPTDSYGLTPSIFFGLGLPWIRYN